MKFGHKENVNRGERVQAAQKPRTEKACTDSSEGRLLDTIRAPAFLLQPDGVLVDMNGAAECLLNLRDYAIRENACLTFEDRESQKALQGALQSLARGEASRSVLTLRGLGGHVTTATLTRVRDHDHRGDKDAVDLRLLVVADRALCKASPDDISAAFRLTPTEALITSVIVDGKSPNECAEMLQVSVSTVRTHLISIYRKTGASSQLHLARMMMLFTLF
jgi:DNA-binding CsgD family transcriptional regulator